MGNTTIEWTKNADGTAGKTWGVLRGCSRKSPGCGGGGSFSGENGERGGCYAERIAGRFSGPDKNGKPGVFEGFATRTDKGARWTGKVALVVDALDEPLRTRKPTTWFISMSDLFHEELTNEEIAAVFGVMAATPRHTYQILTKRSTRMREWFEAIGSTVDQSAWFECMTAASDAIPEDPPKRFSEESIGPLSGPWPLPNVHLGVSVEAAAYKHRLDNLRACPAAVRFTSLEPLLDDLGTVDFTGIHQAIVGAESGHGARPMFEDWVRSIRDQAVAQGTAFFYKQKAVNGRKVSLPMLDGRQWAEMPARST